MPTFYPAVLFCCANFGLKSREWVAVWWMRSLHTYLLQTSSTALPSISLGDERLRHCD